MASDLSTPKAAQVVCINLEKVNIDIVNFHQHEDTIKVSILITQQLIPSSQDSEFGSTAQLAQLDLSYQRHWQVGILSPKYLPVPFREPSWLLGVQLSKQ